MELKDIISWKSVDELPMDNPFYKKVLILSEGRLSGSTSLYVSTDYWQVFFDEIDFGEEQFYDKKANFPDKKQIKLLQGLGQFLTLRNLNGGRFIGVKEKDLL